MKQRLGGVLVALGVLGLTLMAPAPAHAQDMESLLQQIRESGREQQRINREREQRFLQQRNERKALLEEARRERNAARARAERVREEFEAGQARINALKEKLNEASADLGRAYTAARSTAGDLRAAARTSPVTAQYPERLDKLSAIADNPQLPTLTQLEQLWFLLVEDMTATGQVARFEAPITTVLGNRRQAELMRVGAFSAFSEDGYVLLPEGGTVAQLLPSQPGGRFTSAAEDFIEAEAGTLLPALIDPSRGRLLEVEAEKPDVAERIAQGGLVGYTILGIGAVGLILALLQLGYLSVIGGRVRKQLKATDQPSADNPLGRVLGVVSQEHGREDAELLELHLSEAVVKETPRLERFQSLLKLFVAVAPLMGLLGTVTGMILTFQSITLFGTGDPKLMAGGISQALVTTVLGLCVAIPLLFLNSLLGARSRALVQTLDEESALVLAQRLEGDAHA
ncbi:MotA/TolQ/ExbB proton channel family protein [Algiphilus sp.]|uniref:MotA/TolQ/ExbB proton channel family protein n=1 Tax=Algiphilus sp. TaxID=1872431 RepID=UPI003B51BED5